MNPYPPPVIVPPIRELIPRGFVIGKSIIEEVNMEALLLEIWADILAVLTGYAPQFFTELWSLILTWIGG